MPQAIGAIGGALISGISSSKAASAQKDAARSDMVYQKETRDLQRADFAPWRDSGQRANAALDFELGLGARPTFGGNTLTVEEYQTGGTGGGFGSGQPGGMLYNQLSGNASRGNITNIRQMGGFGGGAPGTTAFRVGGKTFATRAEADAYAKANSTPGIEYGGYTKTPGYDFRMKGGMDALESSAAARGGLYSGAALQDSQQFGQDYASNEYGNYLARLTGQAGAGQAAAGNQAVAAGNAATGVSNALAGYGNASAAGAMGVGNAIVGGMQNYFGYQAMQNGMKQPGVQPVYGGGR